MKFVCTEGQYKEFRGYVFALGKPTTITDKATEEALERRNDFRRIDDDKVPDEATQERMEETQVNADSCPKCGKVVRQGRYLHVKFCRGNEQVMGEV